MKILSPIVLFVYNRPWHTQQTIEALQKNELASESELFIYSDEAKNDEVQQSVDEVRAYIDNVDGFKKVTVIKREKNWGLANSIIDGVTNIINKYGKIIVLEDDLVTSPYFLSFMNEALDLYAKEERVGSVTGYIPFINGLPNLYFLKFGASLGWGTWKRVWNDVEFDVAKLMNQLTIGNKVNEFNMEGGFDFYSMLKLQNSKKVDSWAIRFTASTFLSEYLHLRTGNSLIQHIGSDSGTHCNKNDRSKEIDGIITYKPISLEKIELQEDKESYVLYKSFYLNDKVKIVDKIKNKIKGIFK